METRIAVLDDDGKIERFEVVVDPDYEPDASWCAASEEWQVGGVVAGGVYTAPPSPPVPPPLTPDEKLKAFFASNPDVRAYIFGA